MAKKRTPHHTSVAKRSVKHAHKRVEKKRATIHMARAAVTPHRPAADGVVTWQAPDFHLHPRGWTWSAFVVGTGIAAAILFALFAQYTLAVIIFLAGLVMVLGTNDQPELLTHTITPRGFLINRWLLSWNDVKSFWMVSAPEGNKLHLQTVKRGLPVVTVYLGKADPDLVRAAISKYLPEHPTRGELLTDVLARFLKV